MPALASTISPRLLPAPSPWGCAGVRVKPRPTQPAPHPPPPCRRASCTWRLPACCGGRFASPGGTFGAAPPCGLRSRHGAHPHLASVTGAPAPRGAAGAIAHPFGAGWVGLCAPTLTVALPTPHMALGALLRAPPPRERSRPSVVPYQRGNARVLVGYQK